MYQNQGLNIISSLSEYQQLFYRIDRHMVFGRVTALLLFYLMYTVYYVSYTSFYTYVLYRITK